MRCNMFIGVRWKIINSQQVCGSPLPQAKFSDKFAQLQDTAAVGDLTLLSIVLLMPLCTRSS